MGLFGKLFEKKECAFCGCEIGLLGNRKLEDGNMCKECAKKLSPWFDDRRHSTVAQIQEQLDYREANLEKVAAFTVTRMLGEETKVYLDENAGVFMVTDAKKYQDVNPDVVPIADITGVNLDIDERRDEILRRNSDGELESYMPPRYRYYYDFFITIYVRNPYFEEMRFKLNPHVVEVRDREVLTGAVAGIDAALNILSGNAVSGRPMDATYQLYCDMADEIRTVLMGARDGARSAEAAQAAAAAAPAPQAAARPAFCPNCGAAVTSGTARFCEHCGGPLGA